MVNRERGNAMTTSEEQMESSSERATERARGGTAQSTVAELAVAYAKERQYEEALRYFQKASDLSPEARSYYGFALAMRRQRLADAVRYCREAVDREPLRGDWYLNLGQVYLVCGEKPLAVRAFARGLQAEPGHRRLSQAFKRLGIRRRPVIRFLSRTHPVNRYLGWLRAQIRRAV
jgi:tetratricopeptide (TPR) repeat protein